MDSPTAPEARYRQYLQQGYSTDTAQAKAVEALQALHNELLNTSPKHSRPLTWIRHLAGMGVAPVRGLYLWGGVGRGKTWLMNLFFESLPVEQKQRLHFHHFMLGIHEKLSALQGRKNPLKALASELSGECRVLCLDEFIVTNITDAMLLSGLLEALFSNGLVLVATSNREPDDLYRNGLQRERFLPAIELIKQFTRVVHVNGDTDHRLALLASDDTYYTPLTRGTDDLLKQRMQSLAPSEISANQVLSINGRAVETRMHAEEIAWFTFEQLCETPRAAPDYLEIARDYHTIILSDVPVMEENTDDKARRFIYLIDALYDRNVKLIISAAESPDKLYSDGMLEFAFQRTASRLIEMRSKEYLEKPHRGD